MRRPSRRIPKRDPVADLQVTPLAWRGWGGGLPPTEYLSEDKCGQERDGEARSTGHPTGLALELSIRIRDELPCNLKRFRNLQRGQRSYQMFAVLSFWQSQIVWKVVGSVSRCGRSQRCMYQFRPRLLALPNIDIPWQWPDRRIDILETPSLKGSEAVERWASRPARPSTPATDCRDLRHLNECVSRCG
jgi:hypothetical protein